MKIDNILLIGLFVFFSACSSSGGGDNSDEKAETLEAEINRLFPFTENALFNTTFTCARKNSQLSHFFIFYDSGAFDVLIELDTGDVVNFKGTYTYNNDQLQFSSQNDIFGIDPQTSSEIIPTMGLIGSFKSQDFVCLVYGHEYNDPMETHKLYGCPYINVGPASQEENTIEFILPIGLPGNFSVRGAIFRQKNVYITNKIDPIITRGYGIYRRVGDTFYANFGNQFQVNNLLKGHFLNAEQQISVDQLEPSTGPCKIR